MKELIELIRAFEEAQQLGTRTALATVVHVDGSSYRRPGARMLVDDTGRLTGAISGGCLEGDALRKAMLVLSQQQSKLVTYDTMDEDDAKLGVGLGCNGIIQVLIEPIDPTDPNNPIELLKAFMGKRQRAVLVTLFALQNKKDGQPGTCLLLKEDAVSMYSGGVRGGGALGPVLPGAALSGSALPGAALLGSALLEDARQALDSRTSSFRNYVSEQKNLTAFIEYLQPPISLVVVGGGNDVVPLIAMADVLGWQTSVIDGRPAYARADRFAASCHVMAAKPEAALDQIEIDDRTVFLLMTHNYNYDLAILRALIGVSGAGGPSGVGGVGGAGGVGDRSVAYIGSLGPKKKLDRMLDELKAEGVTISDRALSRIFGPSGLDIGAETPEEIALSILAEIKAVLSGRRGQPLRDNTEVIHSRSATIIQKINLDS